VISSVDLETYVRGVLPAEMPRTWPLEALKAQAVAARTFALFRKQSREKANAPYHLEATVMDQVYLVPVVEEGGDESQARVEQAVRETKDLVLLADGSIGSQGEPQPIPAHFHADCGGRTEDARVVWGYKESMGTTVDGSCPLNPLARWKVGFTGEELARKLRGQGLLARGLAKLEAITPFSFTASGRVSQLRLQWSDGESTFISAHDFRMRVGHDRVKSTNFTVERSGPQGEFQIAGQGFGHGVGLCQWGARQLAQGGKDFREILGHYYPKARVTGWEQARDGVVTGIASSEDEIKRRRRL
jgi:stage II sporulation protein D